MGESNYLLYAMNIRVYILFVALCPWLTGCSLGVNESSLETHINESGKRVITDLEDQWSKFKLTIDESVLTEISKESPPEIYGETINSWNDYWSWVIELQYSNRDNSEKYVNYIHSKRAENGLLKIEAR